MKKENLKVELIFESKDGYFVDEPDAWSFNNAVLSVKSLEG